MWGGASAYDFKVTLALTYFDNFAGFSQWQEFNDICIYYANQNGLTSTPFFGSLCPLFCPIIVLDQVDSYLAEKVIKDQPSYKLPRNLILPGIYDLKNKKLIFPQGLVIIGFGIFDYWRKSISRILIH
jgi:hypothetical protein